MSKDDDVKITGFLSVFEGRLEKLISKIKQEYQKPKKERDKANLISMANDAKKLKKLIKKCQEKDGNQVCCPKCNHTFYR